MCAITPRWVTATAGSGWLLVYQHVRKLASGLQAGRRAAALTLHSLVQNAEALHGIAIKRAH